MALKPSKGIIIIQNCTKFWVIRKFRPKPFHKIYPSTAAPSHSSRSTATRRRRRRRPAWRRRCTTITTTTSTRILTTSGTKEEQKFRHFRSVHRHTFTKNCTYVVTRVTRGRCFDFWNIFTKQNWQTTASFWKKNINNIGFAENANFFAKNCRKLWS
jgi:hypothetical protein